MSANKATSKRIWVSIPLISVVNDALTATTVEEFLKGDERKALEVEVAALITKRLMDMDAPFSVDFEASKVEKDSVMQSIPRRLQRLLGIAPKRSKGAQAELEAAGIFESDVEIVDEPMIDQKIANMELA